MKAEEIITIIILSAIIALSGCAGKRADTEPSMVEGRTAEREQVSLQSGSELKQQIEEAKQDAKEYRISELDVLHIAVYREEDLKKTVRVSQNGCISFPLLGKLEVAGKTVSDVEEHIADLLGSDYLVNPQVTVFINEYSKKKVYILGRVAQPGPYEFTPEKQLTVLQAIAQAGGFHRLAAKNRTKIVRVENGREISIPVNVSDVTEHGRKSKDIYLEPNDIIVVPEVRF